MPSKPSDQNKDPWGREKNISQGPPDLDALLRQYKNKLLAALRGKKFNGYGSGSAPTRKGNSFMFGIAALVVIAVWALFGIFIVSPAERAVILRFGRYVETVGSGPHWIPLFIESKRLVNVQRVSNFKYESEMLTKDENIVSVAVAVQYRVENARDFLFNAVDPDTGLQQAIASALRQAVGHNTLDDLLTTGRQQVREQMAVQLRQILSNYHSGLLITDVTLQSIRPPEEVTDAFDDAVKAREDQQSYVNRADAYDKQVTAAAQGQIARLLQEAEADKKQVVLEAQANTAEYLALLPEYQKAPGIMKMRLYLNSLEKILSQTTKVLWDQKNGGPLLYLPLDKLTPAANTSIESLNAINAKPSGDNQPSSPNTPVSSRYPSRGINQ
jgi:modulator of FtsH protease HflK